MKNKRNKDIYFYIFVGAASLLVILYKYIIKWAIEKFGITIKEFLYTIASPMKGADTNFLKQIISYCWLPVLIFVCLWALFCFCHKKYGDDFKVKLTKIKQKTIIIKPFKIIKKFIALALALSVCITTIKANNTFKVTEYISSLINKTTIYEDYYVSPSKTKITAPENKKNLIYIYLESMETTYVSKADGGFQEEINYIPRLTNLANQNISFSTGDKLGGFHSVNGSTWTIAALLATTSGVPFSFPLSGNSMDERQNFASGLTSLGDILEENNYRQMFLCGSYGNFAGREDYFTQHGNYDVVDYYDAIDKQYIPEDYHVWWGYEDAKLYEIAKVELLNLAKDKDTPFNFTMLTVDPHHIDGYVCELCENNYETQLENVLTCADRQIDNFIKWCKQQDFYEDTVIIITGDHPRMDTSLVDCGDYARTIYNCFINTDKSVAEINTKNRVATSLDIFPTVLSALNFTIDGNKLGLGTDLFSAEKTLAENMGLGNLNDELRKYSKYYIDKFS